MLEKILYHSNLIDQQIKQYLYLQYTDKKHKEPCNSTFVPYYKLPYIGKFSTEIKRKVIKYCKYYCKSTNIEIVFRYLKF